MNRNNSFFKTTPLYKEYKILDLIEKNSKITQREISKLVGASVSTINSYIDEYELKGYIKRIYITNKSIEYNITNKGVERKKLLNIQYLEASHKIYLSAKENIVRFINEIINNGYKNILLYGAGEIANLLLIVVAEESFENDFNIVGIIDDDEKKTREVNIKLSCNK